MGLQPDLAADEAAGDVHDHRDEQRRILTRNRELLTIEVSAVVKAMGKRMPAVVDRGHGKRIQDYDT